MAFQKLLCPIDFSAGSQHALRVATRMALDGDAELVIAHAWSLPARAFADDYPIPDDLLQRMIDDQKRGLAAAVDEVASRGVRRISPRLLHGVAWDQIVQAVRDDPAIDLIIMGTHGRSGLKRVLLGSVTERVIRHAPCSVLATRATGGLGEFRNVLCPIDFSDDSKHAIARAGELTASGGSITLLHVIEPAVTFSGLSMAENRLHEVDQRATHELATWAAMASKASVSVETELRIGSSGGEILDVLDGDPTFDLVVMGSHGRTGVQRMLLGSVAEKVLRHAACPVLIVRARRP